MNALCVFTLLVFGAEPQAAAQTALALPGTANGSVAVNEWTFFRVAVPAGTPGFRVVSRDGGQKVELFARKGAEPDASTFDARSAGEPFLNYTTLAVTNQITTAETWFIGVHLPVDATGAGTPAAFTLKTETGWLETLDWDPGTRTDGSAIFQGNTGVGGDFWFKITVRETDVGAWRAALAVQGTEADLFLRDDPFGADLVESRRVGSDGFVISGAQYEAGKELFLMVRATPNAPWFLHAGRVFVHPLGELSAAGASGTNVTVQPEGTVFFKTTIPSDTLAWRLWLNGADQTTRVRKDQAPLPDNKDLERVGRLLVVPDYLGTDSFNGSYFVGVDGKPGDAVRLDSRKHAVADLAFGASVPVQVPAGDFPYRTFRVLVPVQQIGWQLDLATTVGNAGVAVRRGKVPNEYHNEAFSEAAADVVKSLALVPPTLSDGTFYITVYGVGAFSGTLTNTRPEVTDVPFLFSETNQDTNRVGWRYYRVANIDQQLGQLGWELLLASAPPGAQIGLRRNALPGRWTVADDEAGLITLGGHSDYLAEADFLQRPNHPADIWYVGVFSPNEALGSFRLRGVQIIPDALSFDGAGNSFPVAGLPMGKWTYFRVDVPVGAIGWDVRLRNRVQGKGTLAIAKGVLPDGIVGTTAEADLTGRPNGPDGTDANTALLNLTRLKPFTGDWSKPEILLETATYYLGVRSDGPDPLAVTVLSRGVGDGLSFPVRELAFTGVNASVSVTGLVPRDPAWFKVTVPAGSPSWKLRMTPTTGEAMMRVHLGAIAYNLTRPGEPLEVTELRRTETMQKPGDEHFLLLPYDMGDPGFPEGLPPGVHYISVISEGVNPEGSNVGTGSVNFTLTSIGAAPVVNLGNVTETGVTHDFNLAGGEAGLFQFRVLSDAPSIEVRLLDRVGNPIMTLNTNDTLAAIVSGYGSFGSGANLRPTFETPDILSVGNPVAGVYSLSIGAGQEPTGEWGNAGGTLQVRVVPPERKEFAFSETPVAAHPVNQWRYFQFEVPESAVAWDLRLVNVSGGKPRLAVRRGKVPVEGGSSPEEFPQWEGGVDLTGYGNNPDGSMFTEQRLLLGFHQGFPQPIFNTGTYIVGILVTEAESSYTLVSRGIGDGLPGTVTPINFAGGSAVVQDLPSRELAFFRIDVPEGSAPWKIRLSNTTGETMVLVAKRGGVQAWPARMTTFYKLLQKPGDEEFLHLGYDGGGFEASQPGGRFYLAVFSEGVDPVQDEGKVGAGPSSATLTSLGQIGVDHLGSAGGADLVKAGQLAGAEAIPYRFTIPPGVSSVEVRLLATAGKPRFSLVKSSNFAVFAGIELHPRLAGGVMQLVEPELAVLADPEPGDYAITVIAEPDETSLYVPATFTLRIHSVGTDQLQFDGGTLRVTDQPVQTWRYFTVTVPPEAEGWDLRLTNVTSGTPSLFIQKASVPDGAGSDLGGQIDWSGRTAKADGTPSNESMVVIAKGTVDDFVRLEPGTWHIGVQALGENSSYSIWSRGIGEGFQIPIRTLRFGEPVSLSGLMAREFAYYRVIVPTNVPAALIQMRPTVGEAMVVVSENRLPVLTANTQGVGGARHQKPGPEFVTILPETHYFPVPRTEPTLFRQFTHPGGTYYIAVVSEGRDPADSAIGSGTVDFTLRAGPAVVENVGLLSGELTRNITQEAGETRYIQFTVPEGVPAIHIRLEARVGAPSATLAFTKHTYTPTPAAGALYGMINSGMSGFFVETGASFVTFPNPEPGLYTLALHAGLNEQFEFTSASYRLVVRAATVGTMLAAPGAPGPSGASTSISGQLADRETQFFQVEIPETYQDVPVLAWRLDLQVKAGNPAVRVRPGKLPSRFQEAGQSTISVLSESTRSGLVVPPYLRPGIWFIEARGVGISDFTLSSGLVTEKVGLAGSWRMPAAEELTLPAGANAPYFGDSAIVNAVTQGGDGGVDLGAGQLHLYSIQVPAHNAGLLHVELNAISGQPAVFVREDGVPTLVHTLAEDGGFNAGVFVGYHRSLEPTGSGYANFVPQPGVQATALKAGRWVLAVYAGKNSNSRYRLKVASGNIYPGGQVVQPMSMAQTYSDQRLAKDDWRYYRFVLPTPAPRNLRLTLAEQSGAVRVHLRDGVPPGDGIGSPVNREVTWREDNKNSAIHTVEGVDSMGGFSQPGTYTLAVPPLRFGSVYYLGVKAESDAVFTLGLSASAQQIPAIGELAYYGGRFAGSLPAGGTALVRIQIPQDATTWIMRTTNSLAVEYFMEEGTLPLPSQSLAHRSISGGTNVVAEFFHPDFASWPFIRGATFYLMVTNAAPTPQAYVFISEGRNAQLDATADDDGDGLPDQWQGIHFSGEDAARFRPPGVDADNDGFTNLQEFQAGSNPVDRLSVPLQAGAPTVSLSLMGERSDFALSEHFTVRANVTTTGGSQVSRLEFFANQERAGLVTAAPFELGYARSTPGLVVFVAKVLDSQGRVAVSAPLEAFIRPGILGIYLNDEYVTIPMRGLRGVGYRIESSLDLIHWDLVMEFAPSSESNDVLDLYPDPVLKFYRMIETPR